MVSEREHWDSVAGDPPHTMIRHGDWEQGIAADLAMLPAPLDGLGPVLDLGCGIGRLTLAYARRHNAWTRGLDVSPAMIARAVKATEGQYCVSFSVCDGRELGPEALKYRGAFSVLMFQHIPASAQAWYIMEVSERLRPGARFTFQTVAGYDDCFLSHQVRTYEPRDWCEEAGLIVERSVEAVWPQWWWTTAIKPE